MKILSTTFGIVLLLAVGPEPLSIHQMVGYAAILSALGGLASGTRVTRDVYLLIQHVLNCCVLGLSLSLLSIWVFKENPTARWATIGGVGLMSLGGMKSVDLLLSVAKQKFEARYVDDSHSSDESSSK